MTLLKIRVWPGSIREVPTRSLPTQFLYRMVDVDPKILFEDKSVVVVDKPAGLIIHDGDVSVAGWLRRHTPAVDKEPWPDPTRPGIVHRLDRDTSGVLVLAKTTDTLTKLQNSFKTHQIKKIYWAIVLGHPDPEQGRVEVATGRHPGRKTPMAVIPVAEVARGKIREAATDYRVLEKLTDSSLVEATLHTGRTHQVRVHLKYLGHPILGDNVYATKSSRLLSQSLGVSRLMLHAKILGFPHPTTGKWQEFEAHLPPDFNAALERLRRL